jgi:hypothetical protein
MADFTNMSLESGPRGGGGASVSEGPNGRITEGRPPDKVAVVAREERDCSGEDARTLFLP